MHPDPIADLDSSLLRITSQKPRARVCSVLFFSRFLREKILEKEPDVMMGINWAERIPMEK
jgi:hypothetical protein